MAPPKSWRYRCPMNHAGWRYMPQNQTYYCDTCKMQYERLLDTKTGRWVKRDEMKRGGG